jgi:hypothetical protein
MAQDIRKLFESERQQMDLKAGKDLMPKGHESRFLKKLDEALPTTSNPNRFSFLNIAASIVLLIGLSFGAYQIMGTKTGVEETQPIAVTTKSLGDISPQLKKVEDYYLANINLELSKMKVTPESKELFDGYLLRLEELNKEYAVLAQELTESGPSELTVNALINNLKLRLNLLYRLKDKLNELNASQDNFKQSQS